MSAPLRPAARTRTRSSPAPGSGSGRSATTTSPSRMVAARITGHSMEARSRRSMYGRVQVRFSSGFTGVSCGRRHRAGKDMAAIPVPSELLGMPPIWREGRTALELAELLRDPVFREVDPAAGAKRPVLLVPGFLAGDGSLGLMTGWLRRAGHRAHRTGIRLNVDCSARALAVMERRVEKLAARYGRRVAIIGQSRGGTLGRALAI